VPRWVENDLNKNNGGTPNHQSAATPSQIADGLDRVPGLVSRARSLGADPLRQLCPGSRRQALNLAPYSKFQTRNCEIFVAAGNDPAFRKFCELLGMPDIASDPRFATNGARVVHRDALTEVLNARFSNEDGHELTRRMLAAGLPAGPVLNIDEAMAADHTAHRKMVTELGAYRGLGTPIKFSRTPGGTRGAPPHFNEHGEAVLRELGFSDSQIAALAHEGVLVRKRREGRGRLLAQLQPALHPVCGLAGRMGLAPGR